VRCREKKAPQVFEIEDGRLRKTEEYSQDSEALLERADENNHGWTNLKLMNFLEDREKRNTEKGC
jgi:hypothetical protein